MIFIETPTFTKMITEIMDDDHYLELQKALELNPELGCLISGTGGMRKLRWGLKGRGKRGGLRVIYYWKLKEEQIFFLLVYPKNVQENMSNEQLRTLCKVLAKD